MSNPVRVVCRFFYERFCALYESAARNPAGAAAAAVFCGAAVLRLLFIGYGLPHSYFWDETTIVNVAREMIIDGLLWPDYFYNYPSAVIDVQALTSVVSYFVALGNAPEFLRFEEVPVHHFYLLGRVMMTAFAVAAVIFVYRFAADIWKKPWWGVAAAALLALSHHHITESRQVGVDVPLAALTMGGLYFLFRFGQSLSRRDLVASAILWGAAAGTKYNAALFAVPVIITLVAWRQPFRRFAAFGAVAAVTFLVLTPGAIFRLNSFVESVAFEYYHYKVLGHEFLTADRPLADLAGFLWDYTLTPVPVVLLAAGTVALAVSRLRDARLFLLFPVAFVISLSGFRVAQARFIIDLLPMLVLVSAAGFGTALELLRRPRWRAVRVAATAVLWVVVFYGPVYGACRGLVAWSRTDQRTLAARWIHENVPWPAVVVKEVWHTLPLEEGGETDSAPVDEKKYKLVKVDWVTRKPIGHWARCGAEYYICHMFGEHCAARAPFTPGALDGTGGDNDAFWRNFELVASFVPPRYAPYSEPFCIYRLKDDRLKGRHPYRRSLPLNKCLVKKTTYPHDDVPLEGGAVHMYGGARLGTCYTAPRRPYKIGMRCVPELLRGVGPRLRVAVDGKNVADFHVARPGLYWTPDLPAPPPFYHHLMVEYYNDEADPPREDRNVLIKSIYVEKVGEVPAEPGPP